MYPVSLFACLQHVKGTVLTCKSHENKVISWKHLVHTPFSSVMHRVSLASPGKCEQPVFEVLALVVEISLAQRHPLGRTSWLPVAPLIGCFKEQQGHLVKASKLILCAATTLLSTRLLKGRHTSSRPSPPSALSLALERSQMCDFRRLFPRLSIPSSSLLLYLLICIHFLSVITGIPLHIKWSQTRG